MKFHPKKSLGQNFLNNPRVVERIIGVAELGGHETVVEVGPGFGVLTSALLASARKVIAIEKDKKLFAFLEQEFGVEIKAGKLELINGNVLDFTPPNEPYHLVANIPYSITSPILDHFIRNQSTACRSNMPRRAVLMVQKEVAEKVCAKPPRMNVLALHVQTFGTPRIAFKVSKGNFNPQPRVDSAVIVIDFPDNARQNATREKTAPPQNTEKYFELIHKAFGQKRKMLRSTLPVELLEKARIDPVRRPETLSIDEWQQLALA